MRWACRSISASHTPSHQLDPVDSNLPSDSAKGPGSAETNLQVDMYHRCITKNDAVVSEDLIAKYNITDVGVEFLTEIMNPGLRRSEDCLTLNVWTKPQVGEKRKAVLVWLHGGSFVVGTSCAVS